MVATALNVVKFVSHVELFTECEVGSLRDHSDQVEKFASYSIHIFSFLHKACIAPYFQVLQIVQRIDNNYKFSKELITIRTKMCVLAR